MSDNQSTKYSPKLQELIERAYQLDMEDAKAAGRIGYVVRSLTQATMPHSKPKENVFERRNGAFCLTMFAPKNIGLPYGSLSRLILAWITTETVKTQNRELILGDSLSAWMRELKLIPTGGRWGSITRLKNQMKRLASCAISCVYDDSERWSAQNTSLIRSADFWWEPKDPNQKSIWQSTLTLSSDFFEEIISSPIPVRMDVLEVLKGSSMALDIYTWLTYRNSYAKHSSRIPWPALQWQFGAGYPLTERGRRDFKGNFLKALKRVAIVYGEAHKLEAEADVLIFNPGYPDVPKKATVKR